MDNKNYDGAGYLFINIPLYKRKKQCLIIFP